MNVYNCTHSLYIVFVTYFLIFYGVLFLIFVCVLSLDLCELDISRNLSTAQIKVQLNIKCSNVLFEKVKVIKVGSTIQNTCNNNFVYWHYCNFSWITYFSYTLSF